MPAAPIANRSIIIFSYDVLYMTIYFACIDKFTDLWVSLLQVRVNSGLGVGKQLSTRRLTHAVPYMVVGVVAACHRCFCHDSGGGGGDCTIDAGHHHHPGGN